MQSNCYLLTRPSKRPTFPTSRFDRHWSTQSLTSPALWNLCRESHEQSIVLLNKQIHRIIRSRGKVSCLRCKACLFYSVLYDTKFRQDMLTDLLMECTIVLVYFYFSENFWIPPPHTPPTGHLDTNGQIRGGAMVNTFHTVICHYT